MSGSLFIHATNVHQGGGRSLLAAIINALPGSIHSILSLDSRMPLTKIMAPEVHIKRIRPSIVQRLVAERWLAQQVVLGDLVLCFGNLPPLFKLRGHVVVFVQNRYLIDDVNLQGFAFKTKLRLQVERLWLTCRMSNVDEFIVQTPSMKRLLDVRTRGKIPVKVLPFVENSAGYVRKVKPLEMTKEILFDFLYVASGEPHKNHRQLVEAWCLLAKEGLFPSLKLTFDPKHFSMLSTWITEKIQQYQLNIENSGNLPFEQAKLLYSQTRALIYPSTFESFGLPLIEARQAGLSVLASELDYVRDVLDPEQSFDPESAVSIARAVKRFLDAEESPLPLQDATEFMKHFIESVK